MNKELYILFYGEDKNHNEFRATGRMTHEEALRDRCLPVKENYEPNPKSGVMIAISKVPSFVINKIENKRCYNL